VTDKAVPATPDIVGDKINALSFGSLNSVLLLNVNCDSISAKD
jgi:hypothetical protein